MPEENSVEAPAERVARRISVVDDDESIRDATKMLLRSAGYQVSTFACGEDFLNSDAVGQSDCVVLDIRMPGIDGLELQQRLNASQETVPLIFVTAHNDARSRRLAMDGGAVDFLCKPFAANSLVSAVETALTRRAVKRQAAKAT
ncbi:MAG: two-component system response regulator [Terriglobia bacterium]|nr:MAG: two-component system response regulator [Terriglobia bacterium]